MGHGQDVEHGVAGLHYRTQMAQTEGQVAHDGAIGNHHALRESRGTAGIVDQRQFLGRILVIAYVLFPECLGILLAKHHVQMLAGIRQFLRT